MSVGDRRVKGADGDHNTDWLFSDQELDDAEEFLEDAVDMDTDCDVPYTAGYSKDGKTIYIDKDVPETIEVRAAGTRMSTTEINLHIAFAFHEVVEKILEDSQFDMPYQLAHQIALRCERAYVESVGADWDDYNAKTLKIINKIYKRPEYKDVPSDLDLEPYEAEDDNETLEKMCE